MANSIYDKTLSTVAHSNFILGVDNHAQPLRDHSEYIVTAIPDKTGKPVDTQVLMHSLRKPRIPGTISGTQYKCAFSPRVRSVMMEIINSDRSPYTVSKIVEKPVPEEDITEFAPIIELLYSLFSMDQTSITVSKENHRATINMLLRSGIMKDESECTYHAD